MLGTVVIVISAGRAAGVALAAALVLVGCSASAPGLPTSRSPATATISTRPPPGSPAPAGGPCANEYQPVVEGAVWTYHTTADAGGSLQTVDAAVETRMVRGSAFRMVTSLPGRSFPVDWRCTGAGLVQANLGNLTPGAAPSLFRVTHESGVTLPSTDLRRRRWTQVYVLAGSLVTGGRKAVYAGRAVIRYTGGDGKESVTVPAGTYPDAVEVYSDMVAHLTVTVDGQRVPFGLEVEKHSWYVRSVGMVKQVTDASIGFAHVQVTMLLSDVTGLGLSL